jgi:hypothetical protein
MVLIERPDPSSRSLLALSSSSIEGSNPGGAARFRGSSIRAPCHGSGLVICRVRTLTSVACGGLTTHWRLELSVGIFPAPAT